ncbi:long chronological lifespan protein [Pyrenophora teres f. maculata]|nr:long chronological lifespan protein [Pyrenophora teres f. maculata]
MSILLTTILLTLLTTPTLAQFGFFDQMFGGSGGGGQQQGHHHHHEQQEAQNVRSDSSWYQSQYEGAQCTHYLCPGTLSCVHFPHHCPCAWEAVEDKVELGDGIAICGSKGGWVAGEFEKKVEMARKGLL